MYTHAQKHEGGDVGVHKKICRKTHLKIMNNVFYVFKDIIYNEVLKRSRAWHVSGIRNGRCSVQKYVRHTRVGTFIWVECGDNVRLNPPTIGAVPRL